MSDFPQRPRFSRSFERTDRPSDRPADRPDRPPPRPLERVPEGTPSPWVQLRSLTSHPFIFQRMMANIDPQAHPGDIVAVYDRGAQLFGRGIFNPRSQIALRMLSLGPDPIDEAFFKKRLLQAVTLREQLRLSEITDTYRLVHSEGDGLSGLIVERYADWLVFEIFSLGFYHRLGLVQRILTEIAGKPASLDRPNRPPPQWQTFARADSHIQSIEGFRLEPPEGQRPPSVVIREHGLRYRVDIASGHKTGFFCDQRENRKRLATFCKDAQVLDLCCYSGGFSLCAKQLGGAREVTAVDLDEAAIAIAKDNANLNQAKLDFAHADAFIYLRQMIANGRQFDVVVLDPPKFAPTRDDLETAEAKYHDLNNLAAQVIRPGGLLLTCSCSGLVSRDMFIETIHRGIRRGGKRAQLLEITGAGPDHPVMLNCPESFYLKAAWIRVL
ncbi:MAG: class I SAM-dependent rRNA methyltransferase [Phycisphaerae bacterium]